VIGNDDTETARCVGAPRALGTVAHLSKASATIGVVAIARCISPFAFGRIGLCTRVIIHTAQKYKCCACNVERRHERRRRIRFGTHVGNGVGRRSGSVFVRVDAETFAIGLRLFSGSIRLWIQVTLARFDRG
jgi:hypothetical protein